MIKNIFLIGFLFLFYSDVTNSGGYGFSAYCEMMAETPLKKEKAEFIWLDIDKVPLFSGYGVDSRFGGVPLPIGQEIKRGYKKGRDEDWNSFSLLSDYVDLAGYKIDLSIHNYGFSELYNGVGEAEKKKIERFIREYSFKEKLDWYLGSGRLSCGTGSVERDAKTMYVENLLEYAGAYFGRYTTTIYLWEGGLLYKNTSDSSEPWHYGVITVPNRDEMISVRYLSLHTQYE